MAGRRAEITAPPPRVYVPSLGPTSCPILVRLHRRRPCSLRVLCFSGRHATLPAPVHNLGSRATRRRLIVGSAAVVAAGMSIWRSLRSRRLDPIRRRLRRVLLSRLTAACPTVHLPHRCPADHTGPRRRRWPTTPAPRSPRPPAARPRQSREDAATTKRSGLARAARSPSCRRLRPCHADADVDALCGSGPLSSSWRAGG